MNVVKTLCVGVNGEIADSSLSRVLKKTVGTGSVEIGTAVSATGDKIAKGGTAFCGITVSPKQYTKVGLGATLTIPANGSVEVCSFGRIWVKVGAEVTVGAAATYNTATGVISATATGASQAAIPNAKFITAAKKDELAMVELS